VAGGARRIPEKSLLLAVHSHRSGYDMRIALLAAAALLGLGLANLTAAQDHDPSLHRHEAGLSLDPPAHPQGGDTVIDRRQPVLFPPGLRERTLANMRDHLAALQQIEAALAVLDYDQAAEIAEQRLGMSSLGRHGAHEVAGYMPQGMQEAGMAMHRNASRLAAAAQESAASGDIRPTLVALARLGGACVACHDGYRVADSR
jgi:hypothetical protein